MAVNNRAYTDIIRNLGNTIAGVGIVLCVTVAIWLILFVGLMRNARNIWADPSTILVSRSNILANFGPADGTGQPITGYEPPNDGTNTCQAEFQVPNSTASYDAYRAMIKAYQASVNPDGIPSQKPVVQWYEDPDSTGFSYSTGVKKTPHDDDMTNQQKLSLAYYRFLYCTKAYFQDIVNKKGIKDMTFLTSTAQGNLEGGKSSCKIPDFPDVPDTQACLQGQPGTQSCLVNPCFTALNQTIAGQCLFFDDHVYKFLNSTGPKGVLASMEVAGAPDGYQVRAPEGNP